jgi:hypothetical protein
MLRPVWLQILIEKRQAHRIAVARIRLDRLLNDTPRPWFAARIFGGGVVRFGRVTRAEAETLTAKYGRVTFVDIDAAFIAYSDNKNPNESE